MLIYGSSIALQPLVFASIGVLTSQLAQTRCGATAMGLGMAGGSIVMRMVADSQASLHRLLWVSPYG